jgi:hypothetical protein
LRSTLALAVVTLISSLTSLRAQNATRPSANADRLTCGVDSLEVYLVRQGTRQRTGTIVDDCRSSGTGSERLLTRIYRSTDAVLGNRLDTIVDVWSTLEPRRYRSRSSREVVELDWTTTGLRGRLQPEGKPSTMIDEPLRSTIYNSASFDLVVRASPLAAGYTVAVPSYVPSRGVVTLTARVAGDETIDGQAAWRVDADFTGMAVSFWVAKKTRRLLKQVMHVAPGADIEFLAPALRRS